MNTSRHTPIDEEEITLDADSGEEVMLEETETTASALKDKLKKLREELKVCQKERDEHLAGWQRAKADMVNFRRTVEEDRARDSARVRGKIVSALLPALDGFDSAMMTEGWKNVEETWREGMERIATEFHKVLEAEGLTVYGMVGDPFDPTFHDCMSVTSTDEETQDHTIAQVFQKGYTIGGEVIRPAKVAVYQNS
ncbi:MAG: nucleotide exchange factor GrpE [Candidatus Pacebacteria bacterium]|nr:nucleotide exchange factor GrpE [Candidatus Paceibacterota bacterium]